MIKLIQFAIIILTSTLVLAEYRDTGPRESANPSNTTPEIHWVINDILTYSLDNDVRLLKSPHEEKYCKDKDLGGSGKWICSPAGAGGTSKCFQC